MVDVIFYLFCFLLPVVLGLMFLGYFAISIWAKTGDYRPEASGRRLSDSIIEDQFAAIDFGQPSPAVVLSQATAPRQKVRLTKAMRRRAQVDFNTARGTVHLRLLREAQAVLQPQLVQTERQLKSHNLVLRNTSDRHDTELHQAVVRNLVETELHTVPGISPRLASTIIQRVFHGELSNLRNATLVDGIGPQKQAAISNWLANAEKRLPSLLTSDFPGKQEIMHSYQAERERLTREITAAEVSRQEQAALLDHVNMEIVRLSAVNIRDFEVLLADPTAVKKKVNGYLLGSFAPWEEMPDWFARALEGADQK